MAAAVNTKATVIEKKIPDISNLAKKAALNRKTIGIKEKIPDITNLATKSALNTKVTKIENKILDITSFIITPELNRFKKISVDARTKEAAKILANKSEIKNALDLEN